MLIFTNIHIDTARKIASKYITHLLKSIFVVFTILIYQIACNNLALYAFRPIHEVDFVFCQVWSGSRN